MKRAAASRRNPSNRPRLIVAPERETPGIRAEAWAHPMSTASSQVTVSSARRFVASRSAANISAAPIARAQAATPGVRSVSSMKSLKSRPTTTTGNVPTTIRWASLAGWPDTPAAGESRDGIAATIAAISLRKNARIAASVPMCSATSNASPKSAGTSHPKKARASIR